MVNLWQRMLKPRVPDTKCMRSTRDSWLSFSELLKLSQGSGSAEFQRFAETRLGLS